MKLWTLLYAMIWLVFLDFILVLTPVGHRDFLVYGHAVLGGAVLVLAYANLTGIQRTGAPARLMRISRVILNFSVLQVILGVLLFLDLGIGFEILAGVSMRGLIDFVHVVIAFAVITQAASVATAYDMWEEKEFQP